jgi:hypothetical protein
MESKEPTQAQLNALMLFLPLFGKSMRARYAHKVYEVYDAADDDGHNSPITTRTFDALIYAGWVEGAETIQGMPLWRLSAAGRAALTNPPQIPHV